MKKVIKKIKWLNVLEAMLFLGCLALIIHDLFMVTVYGWITSYMVGWTWFGFITFMGSFMLAGLIWEDLSEKANPIKKERA